MLSVDDSAAESIRSLDAVGNHACGQSCMESMSNNGNINARICAGEVACTAHEAELYRVLTHVKEYKRNACTAEEHHCSYKLAVIRITAAAVAATVCNERRVKAGKRKKAYVLSEHHWLATNRLATNT
jgi:hypothetical protein